MIIGSNYAAVSEEDRRLAQELRLEVNDFRLSLGLKPLAHSRELQAFAQSYVLRMIDNLFYGHDDPQFGVVSKRLTAAGFKWQYCQENLAWGQVSAADAFHDLVLSPHHYDTMKQPAYVSTGVFCISTLNAASYLYTDTKTYRTLGPGRFWCQVFFTPVPT